MNFLGKLRRLTLWVCKICDMYRRLWTCGKMKAQSRSLSHHLDYTSYLHRSHNKKNDFVTVVSWAVTMAFHKAGKLKSLKIHKCWINRRFANLQEVRTWHHSLNWLMSDQQKAYKRWTKFPNESRPYHFKPSQSLILSKRSRKTKVRTLQRSSSSRSTFWSWLQTGVLNILSTPKTNEHTCVDVYVYHSWSGFGIPIVSTRLPCSIFC